MDISQHNFTDQLKQARILAGLSLRALALRAETSYSTLSDYETGKKSPSLATYARIMHATGFSINLELQKRIREQDGIERGEELKEVLILAEQFPARHSKQLNYPKFKVANNGLG